MVRFLRLESEEKISSEKPRRMDAPSFTNYLFSEGRSWFWIILGLALVASFVVFVIPEDSFPFSYIRYFFGSLLVLFLPGFTFLKSVFDQQDLGVIERFALSLGLSLAFVSFIGFLLNYTPWGIRIEPVTSCLLLLVLVFLFFGVIRDYNKMKF